VRSSSDRRIIHLELTDAGRELHALLPPVGIKVLNAHLKGFTQAELNQFKGFLSRMQANSRSAS